MLNTEGFGHFQLDSDAVKQKLSSLIFTSTIDQMDNYLGHEATLSETLLICSQ